MGPITVSKPQLVYKTTEESVTNVVEWILRNYKPADGSDPLYTTNIRENENVVYLKIPSTSQEFYLTTNECED